MPNDLDDAALGPADDAPLPVLLPLDFTGARLVATGARGDASGDHAVIATLLLEYSFGDAAVLLPSAGSARRVMLETIRAHHRIAGRPKRRHLLVCSAQGASLPLEFSADAEVSTVAQDMGAIRAEIGPKIAAILVSPVQLAAGIDTLPGSFLADLRESADEYGLLLAFDETDGGLGRTGMAFAHEWTGVTPDLMQVGEGAGLPFAALVMTQKVARGLPSALPPVDAAALADGAHVVETALAEGFELRVQGLGWMLEDRLATLRYRRPDLFSGLVGTGLMQGLVCTIPAEALAERLAEGGLLVRAFGNVLAFLPQLTVEEAEIAAAGDMLERVVAELEAPVEA